MRTAYDPIDTVNWMIEQTRAELHNDQVVDATGRRRRKSKAQAERERERLAVLCEVVWNAEGRPASLDDYMGRLTAA